MPAIMDLTALFLLSFPIIHAHQNTTAQDIPQIIIDTDIMTDCDDVGALAIANVFHNCGLCNLRGVMINTHSEYGALAASAVNTYFNNGHIPIGALRPLNNETFFDRRTFTLSDFASKLAHNFPRTLTSISSTPTPLTLYHDFLATAPDTSLTILSLGFPTNLATLLTSPSPSSSNIPITTLLSQKLSQLILMAGTYPSGREYNFASFPNATETLLAHWPASIPITYSGYELGSKIFSGQDLRTHAPADSPVLAAYEWYLGRCRTIRESWDPVTVMYGILGVAGEESRAARGEGWKSAFAYANEYGYNSLAPGGDGSNVWVNDTSVTNQHWLKLADGWSNETVARMLTQLYGHDPEDRTCPVGYT